MKYTAYKFEFKTGVHFGKGKLDDSDFTFHADTLFSALCIEAVKNSQQELDKLVELFSSGRLVISDAFPYKGSSLFLPKPCCYIEHKEDSSKSTSVLKKQSKKLRYISVENYPKFFKAELDPASELNLLGTPGEFDLRTSAVIDRIDGSTPYSVGVFSFNEGYGLYTAVGYEDTESLNFLEKYLVGLSYAGIGGKRSSGLGRFVLEQTALPNQFTNMLTKSLSRSILISVALPDNDELETAMVGAEYSLIKRSGFTSSFTYNENYIRKKDIYLFDSGSCFKQRFKGKIFDVSRGGNHPVYRYAIPMWIGV